MELITYFEDNLEQNIFVGFQSTKQEKRLTLFIVLIISVRFHL